MGLIYGLILTELTELIPPVLTLSHQYPTRSHSTKLPKTAFLSILCQLLSEYAVRCWDGIWSVEWSATEWWTFFKAPLSVHTAIFFNVKYKIFNHNLEWWTFFKAPFSLHTTSFFNVKCTIFKHTLEQAWDVVNNIPIGILDGILDYIAPTLVTG